MEEKEKGSMGNTDQIVGMRSGDTHYLIVLQEEPLILHLDCDVKDPLMRFMEGIADLRKRYPDKRFQIIPNAGRWHGHTPSVVRDGPITHAGIAFTSWLAIEEPERREEEPKKPKPRYYGGQIGG